MSSRAALGDLDPTGAWLGLGLGVGLALIWIRVPIGRRPRLGDRLDPYLREAAPVSTLLEDAAQHGSWRALHAVLAPVMADAVRWVERVAGGPGTLARRLDQLGGGSSVEQFRAEQVVWAVLGALAGAVAGTVVGAGQGLAVVPVVALVLMGALLGVTGRDQWLSWQVRRREQRVLAEFPAVAELLALSVGAGEGAAGALERVAAVSRGELSAELGRALADVRAGTPLVPALEALAARSSLPSVIRFVDGLAVAIERGTPLADVLRAQAQDVRDLTRRRLMESGGRREIAMMIPIVFLVLPVTVLFALFPTVAVLDLNL